MEGDLEGRKYIRARSNGLVSLKVNRWAVMRTILANVLCQVHENILMVYYNIKAMVLFLWHSIICQEQKELHINITIGLHKAKQIYYTDCIIYTSMSWSGVYGQTQADRRRSKQHSTAAVLGFYIRQNNYGRSKNKALDLFLMVEVTCSHFIIRMLLSEEKSNSSHKGQFLLSK